MRGWERLAEDRLAEIGRGRQMLERVGSVCQWLAGAASGWQRLALEVRGYQMQASGFLH